MQTLCDCFGMFWCLGHLPRLKQCFNSHLKSARVGKQLLLTFFRVDHTLTPYTIQKLGSLTVFTIRMNSVAASVSCPVLSAYIYIAVCTSTIYCGAGLVWSRHLWYVWITVLYMFWLTLTPISLFSLQKASICHLFVRWENHDWVS